MNVDSITRWIVGLGGEAFGSFHVWWRRRSLSAAAAEAYGSGRSVEIWASAFNVGPIDDRWVSGLLDIKPGSVTWSPGIRHPDASVTWTKETFQAVAVRQVHSGESWFVRSGCVALAGEVVGGERIELAVLLDDMALLVDALGAGHVLD